MEATVRITKLAVRRDSSFPVGMPVPCYLECSCGTTIPTDPTAAGTVSCPTCHTVYRANGWVHARPTEN